MKSEIKIPLMGESISEATIGTIIKKNGSGVKMDDEILELETDKVNQVLYAQQEGIITLNVSQGDTVKVGQVIGQIDSEGKETMPPPVQSSQKTEQPRQEQQHKELIPKKEFSKKDPALSSSSEKTSRISKEEAIQKILSEKKEPSIQKPEEEQKDKEKTISQPPIKPLEEEPKRKETRKKMSRIRQVIAKRLVEAQQSAAMLTTFNEIDLTQVMNAREKYQEIFLKQNGVKLGFMSFFVKAVVEALKTEQELNSYIEGDEIVHREYFDIGVAVSTDRGLVVPVIRECDRLSFAEIEKAIAFYAKKAREGGLSVDDLQGGGFTITNGGVYGSLLSTPILNPPQSGILGMHKIEKRAVVVDDQIVIRPMMYVALSYDHRIVDGKEAVSFLISVKNCLEDPARLILHI